MARSFYYSVPLVRLVDVQVHQYPGHGELGEGVHVRPGYRPHDREVKDGSERRQYRQAEVKDDKEDSRGYDKRLLSSHELAERARPLDADPLVFPRHANPLLAASTPLGFSTILHTNK